MDAAREIPDVIGGYMPFAVMDDGEALCTRCVRDLSNPVHLDGENDGWRIVAWDYDGNVDGPVACAHCYNIIVEAYEEEQ